jgi:hypothetical protein
MFFLVRIYWSEINLGKDIEYKKCYVVFSEYQCEISLRKKDTCYVFVFLLIGFRRR